MSRGWVMCNYVGGPWDGRVEEHPAIRCTDSMGVSSEAWFGENPDGSVDVMKGRRGPNWVAYALSIYEKAPPQSGRTGVTYKFVRTEEVVRCAKVLPGLGRRCKNRALEGKELCRDHEKIRVRDELKDRGRGSRSG